MRMDVGLDTGDIIAKKQVRIAEDETGGSLFDKLAAVGAELCVETMQMLENKTATFTPQDNEASTHSCNRSLIADTVGKIECLIGRIVMIGQISRYMLHPHIIDSCCVQNPLCRLCSRHS